jgi:hypothetical protein
VIGSKKKGNAFCPASISLLLAATAGQQGKEKQSRDDPKQRRPGDRPSPIPTTKAGTSMMESLKQQTSVQIERTSHRSHRIHSYLVTTMSLRRELGIPSR